jgi:hypothetical protein
VGECKADFYAKRIFIQSVMNSHSRGHDGGGEEQELGVFIQSGGIEDKICGSGKARIGVGPSPEIVSVNVVSVG